MFDTFGRLMTAIRHGAVAGWQTAYNTYNAKDHIAELAFDFTDYDTRMARYWHNRRYADNTLYHSVNAYANTYKNNESLYKNIRGLYNPIGRLIFIESSKVFGGAINYETFDTGALAISGADDTLLDAIRRVLKWSNFEQLKSLYVREGATMGDIALKVVDDVDRERVRIEVLDPRKVYDVQFDAVGNVKYIDIRYERFDQEVGKWYDYREVIDKDSFQTFRDGNAFAFANDADGNQVAEWENPYGFVPVEWTQHVSTAHGFGLTSYHHVRHKIDNLNDITTLIHDNVRKIVNAKYTISGVRPDIDSSTGKPSTLSTTGDNRDSAPIIYIGDGEMKPLVSPLNIEGALSTAMAQQREIESDLPQLALQRMRDDNSQLSGVAIENMYSDAVDIIGELQGNYNASTRSAIQMAISIGAFRRYEDFRAYNLDSYHNGNLDFDIQPRVIFQDKLSMKEKIELTASALQSSTPEFLLKQIGYGEDAIIDLKREKTKARATAVRTQTANQGTTAQQAPSDEQIPDDQQVVV